MVQFLKHTVTIFLLLAVVVPATFFAAPKPTEAQILQDIGSGVAAGLAGCAIAFFGSYIGGLLGGLLGGLTPAAIISVPTTVVGDTSPPSASIANATAQVSFKECFLDPLLWSVVEALIESLIESMVTWANTGFQGSPTFVQDINGFMQTVADRAVGHFVEGSELSFLCEPFELDIRIALILNYYRPTSDRLDCTLTDITQNITNFYNGTFTEGGWKGWFNIAANPQSTPMGAFILTTRDLSVRVGNRQAEERSLLDFGQGFFTQHDENGNTLTPGTVIQTQLQNWLDAPRGRLLVADEIDELLGVLFETFITSVLQEANGLLGFNVAPQGQVAYADRIRESNRLSFTALRNRLLREIDATIANEQQLGRDAFIADLTAIRDAVVAISVDAGNRNALLRQQEVLYRQIEQQIVALGGGGPGGGTTGTPGTPGIPGIPGIPGVPGLPGTTDGSTPLPGSPITPPGPTPSTPAPIGGGTTGGTTGGATTGGGGPTAPPPPPPPPAGF